jgi:hypothetical protein
MLRSARLLTGFAVSAVLLTSTACATTAYGRPGYRVADRDDRLYYDRGVRDGRDAGAEDARRGRSYDAARHREYRNNRRGDDRGDLIAYRRGFEAGYDDSYRRLSRRPLGNIGRDDRRDVPRRSDNARSRFATPAAANGYRDGLEAGERAARNGDRFDPVRERRYREGDHDYERRDGSRDDYKREYRAAFEQGYADGFRQVRR